MNGLAWTTPGGLLAVLCVSLTVVLLVPPGRLRLSRAGLPQLAGSPGRPVEGVRRFRRLLAPVAGLGSAAFVGNWVGLVLGLGVTVLVWQAVGQMESPVLRRRREQLAAALPHVVDLMAAMLTVGASPAAALKTVAQAVDRPMRDELLLVFNRMDLGMDPVRVWSSVGSHPQLGPLGRCLARALDSGAPVSEAMHRLADDLRRTARAEVEGRARAVGVKAAAPLGLCLLPAFVLIGIVPLVIGSVEAVLSW